MAKRLSSILLPRLTGFDPYQKLPKYAIIAGVFFISVLVALRPTSRLTLLVLGAVFALFVSLFLLRNLALGLLGVLVACLLLPNFLGSGGMGATISPPVLTLVLVLGLWMVDMVVLKKQIKLVRSRITLSVIVFLVVSLIAFLNGQIIYYSFANLAPITAQIGGLLVFFLSIGAILAAGNLIHDLKWLKNFTWLFLALGTLYILGRIIHPLGNVTLRLFQNGSEASIFWIWLAAIAFSQALLNRNMDKRWRVALFSLLVATFYVAITQAYDWKSGWLPPLVALVVILLIGEPKLRIPLLILVGVTIVFNLTDKLGSLFSHGEDYSMMTRVVAWRIVLEIAKVNPILGLGMANYYWYTPLFPILGYSVQFNSHNNYVDIIAQTGVIGLACFFWVAFELGHIGWGLRDRVPDGFPKAYVIGALGGLAGTLVSGMLGDWILPFVYNVGLPGFRASLIGWLFLGGLLALEAMYWAKGENLSSR